MKLRDLLAEKIPRLPRELLPSRAKLIGGVALLRLRPEIYGFRREIGELVLGFYRPRVKAVYLLRGVEGVERKPTLEFLAGDPLKEVVHREHGCAFKFDLTRLMFCLGNSFERLRMAALTRRGEIIVDMFAGIGQFTIPMAVLGEPSKIYAIEINPEAHRYLVENIRLNNVEERVEAILGDCRKVAVEKLEGTADRVLMGYFGGTVEALPAGLKALRAEGGVIHFHELVRRGSEAEFVESILRRARDFGYRIKLIGWRKVKSYSKTRNHIVIDFLALKKA